MGRDKLPKTGARLILVCGLPGSGKTTRAKQVRQELGAVRLCPDEWMAAMGVDVGDAEARDRIEKLQWKLAQEMLAGGQSVVIEWGTWARSERDALRTGARALGAAVELHVLDAPVEILWERIRQRDVGRPAMTLEDLKKWSGMFERPSAEEMALYDEPQRGRHGRSAAEIFELNDRLNQTVIAHLDPAAWLAKPPGTVRNIAAIFTHVHNVRAKWVRLTAPHLPVPAQLHRAHCTPEQARAALAESAARCAEMLAEALDEPGGGVQEFHRDGWAAPWPAGVEMLSYMLTHEAHHRGQVCLLAHQLGFPLPKGVAYGIWNWEKLWTRA